MFLFTYMYNPLQHVSQGKIGYVNVMDTQHAICLERRQSGHVTSAETPRWRKREPVYCRMPAFPGIISCGSTHAWWLMLTQYRIKLGLENPEFPEWMSFGQQVVEASQYVYKNRRYRICCGFTIICHFLRTSRLLRDQHAQRGSPWQRWTDYQTAK